MKYYTVVDLVDIFNVSRSHIAKLCRDEVLSDAEMINGMWHIPKSDVIDYLELKRRIYEAELDRVLVELEKVLNEYEDDTENYDLSDTEEDE